MNTHVVIANEGYISEPMSGYRAITYAATFRKLGNYKVWISEVGHVPGAARR